MAQATAPTSRTREKITGDEEAAAELKLGEFQNVPTLTLSEARLLINAVMDHRKQQRKVEETEYVRWLLGTALASVDGIKGQAQAARDRG